MFKLEDGRTELFQWDLNRRLIISDQSITAVHFCNKTDDCSLVCEVYEEGGARLVNIPNILLQTDWDIRAYAYCGECYTKQAAKFKVNARSKPADYVYTETEVKSWDSLEQRVEALEQGGGGGSAIDLDNGVFTNSVGVKDGLKIGNVELTFNGEEYPYQALIDQQGDALIGRSVYSNGGIEFGTPNPTGTWTTYRTGVTEVGYWKSSGNTAPDGSWEPAKFKVLATEEYVNNTIADALSELVNGDEVSY